MRETSVCVQMKVTADGWHREHSERVIFTEDTEGDLHENIGEKISDCLMCIGVDQLAALANAIIHSGHEAEGSEEFLHIQNHLISAAKSFAKLKANEYQAVGVT